MMPNARHCARHFACVTLLSCTVACKIGALPVPSLLMESWGSKEVKPLKVVKVVSARNRIQIQ